MPEFVGDNHFDWMLFQSSHSGLVMVINEFLVGKRSKALGATTDCSAIDEFARILIGLEHDEELAHHASLSSLIEFGRGIGDISDTASGLALELVDIDWNICVFIILILVAEPSVVA